MATKVDNDLAERFYKYCEGKGCTPSEGLRSLIKLVIGESRARTVGVEERENGANATAAKKDDSDKPAAKVVLLV